MDAIAFAFNTCRLGKVKVIKCVNVRDPAMSSDITKILYINRRKPSPY